MYQWLVFVHLVGLVLFVFLHGVSMWAVFAVRRNPDPDTARLLLGMSVILFLTMLGSGASASRSTGSFPMTRTQHGLVSL